MSRVPQHFFAPIFCFDAPLIPLVHTYQQTSFRNGPNGGNYEKFFTHSLYSVNHALVVWLRWRQQLPAVVYDADTQHPANDGDIENDAGGAFHVNQGNVSTVFAGIDAITGSEFRAFLDFSLTGAGGVPGNAVIDSATLDIFIDSISQPAAASIPIRIDLVSFPPHPLLASDYDRTAQPALTFARTFIVPSDFNHHVTIDVTPLMVQAQISGLSHFQLRILEDFGSNIQDGLVEIDDTTVNRAPLLEVTYH
jgi:hypothetical protein